MIHPVASNQYERCIVCDGYGTAGKSVREGQSAGNYHVVDLAGEELVGYRYRCGESVRSFQSLGFAGVGFNFCLYAVSYSSGSTYDVGGLCQAILVGFQIGLLILSKSLSYQEDGPCGSGCTEGIGIVHAGSYQKFFAVYACLFEDLKIGGESVGACKSHFCSVNSIFYALEDCSCSAYDVDCSV